jgi:hypothetical protein
MTHGPELVPLQAYMAAKCEVCVCDCQSKIDALQAEVEELKGAAETGNNAFRSMAAVAAGWKDRALAAEARVKELIDADAGRNALLDKAEARVDVLGAALQETAQRLGADGADCWCNIPSRNPYRRHDTGCETARAALGAAPTQRGGARPVKPEGPAWKVLHMVADAFEGSVLLCDMDDEESEAIEAAFCLARGIGKIEDSNRTALRLQTANNHLARHGGSAVDWDGCSMQSCVDARAALGAERSGT